MVDTAGYDFCQNGRTMVRYARVVVVEVPGGEVSPGTNIRCGYGGAMLQDVQDPVVILHRVAGARGEAPNGLDRGAGGEGHSRGSGKPGGRSEDTAPSAGDDVPEAISLGKVLVREAGGEICQQGREIDV